MAMAEDDDLIVNAVLLSLFPSIARLKDYLAQSLDDCPTLIQDNDPTEYKDLLHNTLVANNHSSHSHAQILVPGAVANDSLLPPFPRNSPLGTIGNHNEIVDLAIEQTCPKTRSWFNGMTNILAIGYTNSRQTQFQQAKNYFPNTLEAFVRSPQWEVLLSRIGDAAMLYLLVNTSMFVALPNNCYCQITGPAISEQALSRRPLQRNLLPSLSSKKKRSHPDSKALLPELVKSTLSAALPSTEILALKNEKDVGPCEEEKQRPLKRMKLDKEETKVKAKNAATLAASTTIISKIITPSTILFKRSRVFYVKRYHTESTMLQHFLFSGREIESDHSEAYCSSEPSLTSEDTVDMQIIRMFPRQYGLENVFVQNTNCNYRNNRNHDSKRPVTATKDKSLKVPHPWRLRQMRQLVISMLQLHRKCKYKLLLQYYCPVKVIDDPSVSLDTSTAALLQCHSSFDQVTSFVHSIVKKVIPLSMFGSEENRIVVLRAMTRFIRLRRFETFSLQYVLQGFKMSHCGWLEDTRLRKPGERVKHIPPSASDKQHEILQEFMYWLFNGFLIPLLQASFYVTDSSFQRNKVFYYRHKLWHMITKPSLNSMKDAMFAKLTDEEASTCNRVYANVRLLPKEHDLRPIINLRRKSPKLVNGSSAFGTKSTNQRLMNAFLVLAYERGRQAPQQINSAIGMSDLYQRLKQVKNKLVGPSRRNLPKLYMVKVDIKKAFDSINQDNLLKIIDGILKEDIYMIHRHSKVMPSNGMITKRFLPKAIAPNEMPSFLGFARSQAEISKHAVLIDKVVHSFESKAAILDLVQEHISENIVKFGSDYYRQTTGVPQGSILSPALCRFFYDEMEKDVLSDFSQTEDSALLRLVDDFLFISQSQSKAAAFLKKMWQGHPDYGCFINEKKTLTNFDITVNGASIQRCQGNDFPYCGLLINSKTLEIRVDYSRYHGENVRNLLTVVRDLHPGRSIVLKMKKAMQYTCQMAFSDTSFNSISQVMLNIYQNFNFCCMKFHAYLLELCLDPVISSGSIQFLQQQQQRQRRIQFIQPAALYSIVLDIFRVCFGLLHNSRRSTVGVAAGAVFKIGERHVRWLGAMAFLRTLPNLPIYDPLKIMLQEQILNTNQDQNHYFKRILHSVVKDSRNRIMDTIQYQ